MISTNDFRTGVTIVFDSNLWTVVDFQHVKPGKGSAFVRTRLKNVLRGNILEKTFRAGEMLERAIGYARRSAQRAVDLVAFAAGVADYSFALDLADRIQGYPDSSRYELLMAKGEAEFFGGMHRPAIFNRVA